LGDADVRWALEMVMRLSADGARYRRFWLSLFLAVSLLFPATILAFESPVDAPPLILNEESNSFALSRHMEIFEDSEANYTIDDVSSGRMTSLFSPNTVDYVNFGFSKSAFWVRLEVENRSSGSKRMIFEIANPLINRLELYESLPGGGYSVSFSGNELPFGKRPVAHRDFLFRVNFEPGEKKVIYLRSKTSSVHSFPALLADETYFYSRDNLTGTAFGVVFGAMLALLFYNMFVYSALRDISYLHYILYIASVTILMLALTGFGNELFYPDFPWFAVRAPIFFTGATLFFVTLFTRQFLSTEVILPRYDFVLIGIATFGFLLGVSPIVSSSLTAQYFFASFFASLVCPPLLLAAGILSFRKGQRSARYFIIGWIFLLVGTIAYGLITNQVIPGVFRALFALMAGFPAEAILFSLALADRINFMRVEKEIAQAEALNNERMIHQILQRGNEELERKVTERTSELTRAKVEAEKATKLKDQFVTLASHDLRSPLAGVLGLIQHLKDAKRRGAEADEIIERIIKISEQMSRTIEHLLDISRLKTGVIKPERKMMPVRMLLEDAISHLAYTASVKNIGIKNNVPEDLKIFGDMTLLSQVFQNLISNAVKFSHSGSSITLYYEGGGSGEFVTIGVRDRGVGISNSRIPDLFRPEIKTSTAGTEGEAGSGFGLPYCLDIVVAHGGELRVESIEGEGSTFYVALPVPRQFAG